MEKSIISFANRYPFTIAIIIVLFGIYFLELRESLQVNTNSLQQGITKSPPNLEFGSQGEKLPPSFYQQTRGALEKIEAPEQARSVRGQQDVWRQITPQSSKFIGEEQAKQMAKATQAVTSITNMSQVQQDALAQTFLSKAADLAGENPALAAALVSGQGLAGYMKASGQTREQVATQMGVTLEDVDTLSAEKTIQVPLPDLRKGVSEEVLAGLKPEQQTALKGLMQKVQVQRQPGVTAENISKADPKFRQIQTNLVKFQDEVARMSSKQQSAQADIPPRYLPTDVQ